MSYFSKSDLSVIIVNYNTADFLYRCLKSVVSQAGVGFEIFVVDNASQDNSRNMIKTDFPGVQLIKNEHNVGFSKANNQAISLSAGRYLLFLNPDTEVRPDAFETMIRYMDSSPDTGLAGSRLLNPDSTLQSSVENRYPGEKYAKKESDELKKLKGDIAWVSGASMIARREVIENIGGFDETFFLYGEEIDLCLRTRIPHPC